MGVPKSKNPPRIALGKDANRWCKQPAIPTRSVAADRHRNAQETIHFLETQGKPFR